LSYAHVCGLNTPGAHAVARGPAPPLNTLAVTCVLQRTHSSSPHGSSVSLFGDVSIVPLPFLSMQSGRLAATFVTHPVPRFETTTKCPSMLTDVRDVLAAPLCVGSAK
jgi:hypothetical protein